MLQHDPESSQNGPDAAHTRVKVDVLARAIAAIEERRQEQARQREGTALIGDVVRDLQIDATPEELLAEVEVQQKAALFSGNSPAQKDAYADAGTQGRTKQQSKSFWLTMSISLAWIAAIIFVVWFVSSLAFNDPIRRTYLPSQPTYPPSYTPTAPSPQFLPVSPPLGTEPALLVSTRGGPVGTLAAVADERPFGCSYFTLQFLLHHMPLSRLYLYDAERDMTYDARKTTRASSLLSPNSRPVGLFARSSWTLIKHNGQVYLRGWAEQKTTQQVTSQNNALVFNSQPPVYGRGQFVPITLSLGGIRSAEIYQSLSETSFGFPISPDSSPVFPEGVNFIDTHMQMLLVHGLHLDSHAYETWNP